MDEDDSDAESSNVYDCKISDQRGEISDHEVLDEISHEKVTSANESDLESEKSESPDESPKSCCNMVIKTLYFFYST